MAERDSHIWVGTDGGGINIIHPDSHRITVLEHIPGDNYSLPVNSILSLYNDNYNNMVGRQYPQRIDQYPRSVHEDLYRCLSRKHPRPE